MNNNLYLVKMFKLLPIYLFRNVFIQTYSYTLSKLVPKYNEYVFKELNLS